MQLEPGKNVSHLQVSDYDLKNKDSRIAFFQFNLGKTNYIGRETETKSNDLNQNEAVLLKA